MRLIFLVFFIVISSVTMAAPDGSALYASHCSACHGDRGGGGVGVPLSLPSFLESVDDSFLAKTIRHGRPGRVMPAFSKLSDAQINAIVSHIRGWSEKPAPQFSAKPVAGDVAHGRELRRRQGHRRYFFTAPRPADYCAGTEQSRFPFGCL